MGSLIVLPTYNEAGNVESIVEAILGHAGFSVLIVDDNSPDGTGAIADSLEQRHPQGVEVMHRAGKQGLGTAYIAGFRRALARGDEFVFEMDADFSHDPADLPRMLAAAERADVVIGSRYVPGGGAVNWPFSRYLISRGGSIYTKLVLGIPVNDPTSGFKCFRREALQAIDLSRVHASGFSFQVEMNWRCDRRGLRIAEVPIRFVDRKVGQSKMSRGIFLEAMVLVWRLRLEDIRRRRSPEAISA